jgi:hypothetical protein
MELEHIPGQPSLSTAGIFAAHSRMSIVVFVASDPVIEDTHHEKSGKQAELSKPDENSSFRWSKIPKFPTPQPHKTTSLASDAAEPSAVFWRVLGATESETKELDDARSCSRAGTGPALRRSFNR